MLYSLADLLIDTGRQSVQRGADFIPLPKLSYDLLLTLVQSAPNVLSMDELMGRVWPGLIVSPETISQRVKLLRDALGDDSKAPRYIVSLRGRGYQIVAPVADVTEAVARTSAAATSPPPAPPAAVVDAPAGSPASPAWASRVRPRYLVAAGVICAACVALVAMGWQLHRATPSRDSQSTHASIAVLPFESSSQEPDAVELTDGIQGEIRSQLEKISSIKVIAWNSAQMYGTHPDDLALIARQLGVATLLRGVVERSGDRTQIHLQLLEAYGGLKIWEASYDRRSNDIAGVEQEAATAVANALQAKLSVSEQQSLTSKSVRNPEAHDAYLHAVAISHRRSAGNEEWDKLIHLLETAVRVDPNYAEAWALLAQENAHRYFNHYDKPVTRLAAHVALEKAMQLQPDLPETLVAEGYYFYWVEADYTAATRVLLQVRAKWPNNVEAPVALARMARRQGHVLDTAQYFEAAIALDPRNLELVLGAGDARLALRQAPAALKLANYALDVAPGDTEAIALKCHIYQSQGDLDGADEALRQLRQRPGDLPTIGLLADQAIYRRRYADAIALMRAYLAKPDPSSDPQLLDVRIDVAHVLLLNHDRRAAMPLLGEARNELENLRTERPDDPVIIGTLAMVRADLGDTEAAGKLIDSVFKLEKVANDEARINVYEMMRARVAARTGNKDQALASLQMMLRTDDPWVTVGFLQIDPEWDPLRDDPRFRQMMIKK